MMHILACLGARKDGGRSFHHCGGLVKLVQGCFWARKIEKGIFMTVEVL